jgi:hypothetical protein
MRALLIALWLATSAARAEQGLPVYPSAPHARIGNDLVIGGEYYRIGYFTTADSPRKVARYFASEWAAQGIPTIVEGDFQQEGVVSAFYTREGLQRAVVLRVHRGKTLGFVVLRDLWTRPEDRGARRTALPPLEGALFSQEFFAADDVGRELHRGSVVEEALPRARSAVAKRLEDSGYSLLRERIQKVDGQRHLVLEHTRPGEQVVSTLVEVEEGMTAVLQSWAGSDRPDGVPNDVALEKPRAAEARQKGGR